MKKSVLRNATVAAALAAALLNPATAQASPETDFLDALNGGGIWVYDTSRALSTGYWVCDQLNYANGQVVANNLFYSTTWTDTPSVETASVWVVAAATTLCPWHWHGSQRLDYLI